METIEEKIKNSKRWKDAKIDLERFNKIIQLIENYPIKLMRHPISPQYELGK